MFRRKRVPWRTYAVVKKKTLGEVMRAEAKKVEAQYHDACKQVLTAQRQVQTTTALKNKYSSLYNNLAKSQIKMFSSLMDAAEESPFVSHCSYVLDGPNPHVRFVVDKSRIVLGSRDYPTEGETLRALEQPHALVIINIPFEYTTCYILALPDLELAKHAKITELKGYPISFVGRTTGDFCWGNASYLVNDALHRGNGRALLHCFLGFLSTKTTNKPGRKIDQFERKGVRRGLQKKRVTRKRSATA
jgi:hypothetical protein